jgi:hypothetical protein
MPYYYVWAGSPLVAVIVASRDRLKIDLREYPKIAINPGSSKEVANWYMVQKELVDLCLDFLKQTVYADR